MYSDHTRGGIHHHERGARGFTLVEIAVTVMVFGLIMLFSFGVFANLNRSAITNDTVARTQSGLRAAMDEVSRSLRSAGVDIDYASGQRNLVYADGFQLAFNANIWPLVDDGTGFPQALVAGAANAGVPSDGAALYTPPATFQFGAETILYTLDSNRDGVITDADKGDDPEEASTNPNDYVLYRSMHGFDGGANTVDRRKVALVRGPEADPDGNATPPMFSYWIDHDDNRATDAVLLGDADGDGFVTGAEGAAVGALTPAQLARVERIGIQMTGETATPNPRKDDNDGYERISFNSEVSLRQHPRTTSVVFGSVFHDRNENGVREVGEEGLSGVRVRSSAGANAVTGPMGNYMLTLSPVPQNIIEDDPLGYTSVSANNIAINPYRGEFVRVDFADVSNTGTGQVSGLVYHDLDEDGERDGDEPGISNVVISSDSGETTKTGSDGRYAFEVPFGNRVITETDSTGYSSTTPNEVSVFLDKDTPSGTADFGDILLQDAGTIEGYVYLDEDKDMVRDNGEGGVPGATIVVDGQSTTTDNAGFFSITVKAGSVTVTEIDPPGYSSTTPNTLNNVSVKKDETTVVMFGDMVVEDVDFDVIELAETEQALSIAAGDLDEDNRGDPDLFLGTRFTGGSNNLLVWYNNRKNHKTPNSAIFESTPSLTRATNGDVTTLLSVDLDLDNTMDIVTGFAVPSGNNVSNWVTGDGGAVPGTPGSSYVTYKPGNVLDAKLADFDNDGIDDMLIGVETGTHAGHFEIWWGQGNGAWDSGTANQYFYDASGAGTLLGAIYAVAAADVNGDGWVDAIVGSRDATGISSVHVYQRIPGRSEWIFLPWQNFGVNGNVTDLVAVDMVEDGDGDVDIVVSYQVWDTTGGVDLWLQDFDGQFGVLNEGTRSHDDQMTVDGSPLVMEAMLIDGDLFPDLVIGTRSGVTYSGHIDLARTFGYLPSAPQRITDTSIGEVITLTGADFNMDGIGDLAAGTRNSASTGRVYLLYRK